MTLPMPLLDPAPPPRLLGRGNHDARPRLSGPQECDALVIGGGYTGSSTALHLAEQGKQVVLLEAKEIGWGASGRSFGQIVPSAKQSEGHILKTFGMEQGQGVIDLLADGPRLVFDLVHRFGIDCDDFRSGMIVGAHSRKAAAAMKARQADLSSQGLPVEFLEGTAAADLIGSDYYPACLLDRRAGALNPQAYVRGLAAAAQTAGAQVFCDSAVTALAKTAAGWKADTAEGSISAPTLVLAVNAYAGPPFTDHWPKLARALIPMRAYQLISEPLSENVSRTVLPQRQSMIDSRHLFSGIRLLNDGRLQVGVDGPAFSAKGQPRADLASRRILETFPQIQDLRWAEAWPGWVAVTNNLYPRLHQLEPGVWCAYGYSGRGIAFGTLMGREIARNILRDPEAPPRYPVTPLKPLFGHAFAPIYVSGLLALYRRMDSRAMKGYLRG